VGFLEEKHRRPGVSGSHEEPTVLLTVGPALLDRMARCGNATCLEDPHASIVHRCSGTRKWHH
jgi:hypothetical protein